MVHSQLVAHPHVIDLYAAFEDNDKVYLLQEYAAGVSGQCPAPLAWHWGAGEVWRAAPVCAPGARHVLEPWLRVVAMC